MDSLKIWHRPFPSAIKIRLPFGVPGAQWKSGYHEGDDFEAPLGTPVEGADNGVVRFCGDGGDGFGHYISVDHSDMTRSYYAHLSEIYVAIGAVVMRGMVIGKSGNSGNVWHDGRPVTNSEREQGIGSHCHVGARDENGKWTKMNYGEA